MTQQSSLHNLFLRFSDFFKRCFSKHYPVSHDPKNLHSAKHDFLRCPYCNKAVDGLMLYGERIKRCRHCGKIVLVLMPKKCKCGELNDSTISVEEQENYCQACGRKLSYDKGVFRDLKKREFILKKNLYPSRTVFQVLLIFFCLSLLLVCFKIVPYPEYRTINDLRLGIFLLIVITISISLFLIIVDYLVYQETKILHLKESTILATLFSIIFTIVSAWGICHLEFEWVEVPTTKTEWQEIQDKTAKEEFYEISATNLKEKFLFSINAYRKLQLPFWQEKAGEAIIEIGKNNKIAMIRLINFNEDISLLLPKHKNEIYQMLIKYYQDKIHL